MDYTGRKTSKIDLQAGLLKVYGKSSKERQVPMCARMIKSLHFYLNRWRNGTFGEKVFCHLNGKPITSRYCIRLFRTLRKSQTWPYFTPDSTPCGYLLHPTRWFSSYSTEDTWSYIAYRYPELSTYE